VSAAKRMSKLTMLLCATSFASTATKNTTATANKPLLMGGNMDGMLLFAQIAMSKCEHLHTPVPEESASYLGWHAWADKMSKAHNQKKCPACGLWKIWVPKQKRKSA